MWYAFKQIIYLKYRIMHYFMKFYHSVQKMIPSILKINVLMIE